MSAMDRFYSSDYAYDAECFQARDAARDHAVLLLGKELQARGRLLDCRYPDRRMGLNPRFAGEIAATALGLADDDLERASIHHVRWFADRYESNLAALAAAAGA